MRSESRPPAELRGNALQLTMATGAFAACFAVFGSVSAMMPILKRRLDLGPVEVSLALAIPVLLGSLGRVPLGMLADRYGGRRVFLAVLAASAVAVGLMGAVSSYGQLLACGFALGIALASFSVGVGFVSRWYPASRQGAALGVYGAGNVGQSLAAFGAPLVAGALGFRWGFWAFGLIALGWLVAFAALARDAGPPQPARPLRDVLRPLADRRSWALSLYYFLTFGGFVAMAVYLPTFLTDLFHLTPQDAGLRTAGFVVLATAARPLGGVLADRVGGRRILLAVFPAIAAMAALMAVPAIGAFTVGALGMAAAIGLGNGAVFKLVPEYFPASIGSVTGLVGAAGGLGGFFPPLALGVVHQATGAYAPGFALLGAFALVCLALLWASGRPARATAHGATRARDLA
ncbi:MFS transporter [Sorangium sp. So ce1036]|uniref:MFS transporter n=1 Tax=Sorangium sp. So ce1036 TaxID=3133328 RepID=UPI003F12353B